MKDVEAALENVTNVTSSLSASPSRLLEIQSAGKYGYLSSTLS